MLREDFRPFDRWTTVLCKILFLCIYFQNAEFKHAKTLRDAHPTSKFIDDMHTFIVDFRKRIGAPTMQSVRMTQTYHSFSFPGCRHARFFSSIS